MKVLNGDNMCDLVDKFEKIEDIASLNGVLTLEEIYKCNRTDCKKICESVTSKYELADVQADYLDNQIRDTLPDDEEWW